MTTSQKAALSLLISVLLFGAFTALSYTGLFDLIETRFFNPYVTASITREITKNADTVDKFLEGLQTRFSESLNEPSVRRSFLPNQSAEDIFERSRIYGLFGESIDGFQWVRFIDSGGIRLHYSSYAPDILNQERLSVAYRNFDEQNLPYSMISASDGEDPKYLIDESGDRILFSFPFYDSFDVYRGTALFSLSVKALTDMLVNAGGLKINYNISVVSDPPGFFSGVSGASEGILAREVAGIWKEESPETARLVSRDSDLSLLLISARSSQGFFIGRLVDEEAFALPEAVKIILLASFFLTVYLVIFLLFNLRQDSVVIVQNRLKQLQISLIEQYYERKSEMDWNRWSRELEQRRDDISAQIKHGIRKLSGQKGRDIDALMNKSWDELLSVMGGRKDTGIDEEKLQIILNRILAAMPKAAGLSSGVNPVPLSENTGTAVKTAREFEESPAFDETEEAAAVEELEEIEEVAPVEEVQALDETEEAAAVEELEEIEEVAPVEEVQALDETEEEAAVEELEEVEEAASVEESPALDEAEEGTAVEELEEVEEVTALDEGEEAAAVEELEAAASVEEVQVIDETEEAAAPVEKAEDDEEIVTFEETETAEDSIAVEEAADVPVIDMAGMNLSREETDAAINGIGAEDEIGELEELGAVEEVEELEEEISPSEPQHATEADISNLASQIEFDAEIAHEVSYDESVLTDLEIVSPFSRLYYDGADEDFDSYGQDESEEPDGMREEGEESSGLKEIPDFSASGTGDEEKPESVHLYLDSGPGSSLVYKPFNSLTESPDGILTLPADSDEGETSTEEAKPEEKTDVIIEEREGVHYISGDVLKSNSEDERNLDRNFKSLVDSIIK